MSKSVDYTSKIWENNKLNKYKKLCDFNKSVGIDKNMMIMESLNLNCSAIVEKSSKLCDQSSIEQNEEFEKIKMSCEEKPFEEIVNYEADKRDTVSDILDPKLTISSMNIQTQEPKNQALLPDDCRFDFEHLNFSLNENVATSLIDNNIAKIEDDLVIVDRKPSICKKSIENGLKIDSHFKTFYQEYTNYKNENKMNATNVNSSQKSATTNVTSKTQTENPSKLYSFSFQNLVEKYSKIQEKIKVKTSNFHHTRIKLKNVATKANSISTMVCINPPKENEYSKSAKKNSMIEGYSKFSALDTFVSTAPIKTSSSSSVNKSAYNQKRKAKSNMSFNKSISKIK
jgi:hypothetical protein